MNKKFTIVILAVVLVAMGLVFVSHLRDSPAPSPEGGGKTAQNASAPAPEAAKDKQEAANPLQAQQGGMGGPPQIEPPLGVAPGRDGAPRPITLTTSGQPSPGGESAAPQAEQAPSAAAPSKPESKTPSLTPWELPPQPGAKQQNKVTIQGPGQIPAKTPDKAPAKEPVKPAAKEPEKPVGKKPERGAEAADKAKAQAAEKSKQTALSEKEAHTLKSIQLKPSGQSMVLRIEADSDFPCKTFVLTGPDRLVIDLPGTWKGVHSPSVPQNLVVKNARAGQQPAGPRLVLDLAKPISGHKVQRSGNVVEVVLMQ